jgi:hypothetical protein
VELNLTGKEKFSNQQIPNLFFLIISNLFLQNFLAITLTPPKVENLDLATSTLLTLSPPSPLTNPSTEKLDCTNKPLLLVLFQSALLLILGKHTLEVSSPLVTLL